jgi:hypothetical protein
MNKAIFFGALLAFMLAVGVSRPALAQVDPASLAQQDVAAESRGDVAAALALYSHGLNTAEVQIGLALLSPKPVASGILVRPL